MLFALLFVVMVSGTAQAQVSSDYDKSTDFSKYTTYAFAGWHDDSDRILSKFDKDRILSSLKAELDSRGMQLVEKDADAVFTLFVHVDEKTSTTAYTNYVGGYGYGYNYGWVVYPAYGGGMTSTTISERDYQEGTLIMNMYDDETKDMVWQGILVTEVERPEKREHTIPKKMHKLMKKFPKK